MSEKRIKVLFITRWYLNRYDPQLAVFIRKHAAAAALYCDVALLYFMRDANQRDDLEFEEKNEFGIRSLTVYYKKRISYFRAVKAGLKRMRNSFGRHDITHAYIMLRPAVIAYWLKLFRKTPFVISEQWSGYATGKFNQKIFFEKFVYRWVFKKAKAVTSVSEFLKSKMISCGLEGDYVITPNVIEKTFETIQIGKNEHVHILIVADLVDEIKNISGVIAATGEVVKTNPAIRLDIVGHGPDEKKLKKLATELNLLDKNIFFHGVKTNEEVYDYLVRCDFLVMNSRFETFSLICAEALSCGKPVIATRCGGPEEFINVKTGILIQPDNAEELKMAMLKMIETRNQFNSAYLRDYALNKFSAPKIGNQFFEVYKKVLKY